MPYPIIQSNDPEVFKALSLEDSRQESHLELIASENFVSQAVLEAYTATLSNKYAEGYPNKRYYGGCAPSDMIEELAIERAKKLFNADYANVQPHSGAQANMAVFLSVLNPGDCFLGMNLDHGGHLTHGSKVNFSGLSYTPIAYGVNPKTHLIDYDEVEKLALKYKPKLIIVGASSYPRIIDFPHFRKIADKTGSLIMVDMAHIAGLVATGEHPSPLPYADFITTTTHKTLRGPRGGLILSNNKDWFKTLNTKLFPGIQGGPLMHVIAAKAVAFGEALQPGFKTYQSEVCKNAKILAKKLLERGLSLISGGTENHLMLVNTYDTKGITGKEAQNILESIGIITNKNTLPFDKNKPAIASGIRIGTPALTTRGLGKDDFKKIGNLIADTLEVNPTSSFLEKIKSEVKELCNKYPMEKFRYNYI